MFKEELIGFLPFKYLLTLCIRNAKLNNSLYLKGDICQRFL